MSSKKNTNLNSSEEEKKEKNIGDSDGKKESNKDVQEVKDHEISDELVFKLFESLTLSHVVPKFPKGGDQYLIKVSSKNSESK